MYFYPSTTISQKELLSKLSDSILIIPNVSIGNLPQLSIDLLISNFKFEKIGSLDDLYLYPFVSPNDLKETSNYSERGFAHSLELFYNEEHHITLIQQRSPIIPGYLKSFSTYITHFVKYFGFKELLILDSSDFGTTESNEKIICFNDDLLSQLRKLKLDEEDSTMKNTNVSSFSKTLIRDLSTDIVSHVGQEIQLSEISGSSEAINLTLKDSGHSTTNIKISCILIYCYEGDNCTDAEILATRVTRSLNIDETSGQPRKWIQPLSWKGVYGDRPVPNALEDGLFG